MNTIPALNYEKFHKLVHSGRTKFAWLLNANRFLPIQLSVSLAAAAIFLPPSISFSILVNDPVVQASAQDEKLRQLLGNTVSDPTLLKFLKSKIVIDKYLQFNNKDKCSDRPMPGFLFYLCKQSKDSLGYDRLSVAYAKGQRYEDLQIITFSFVSSYFSLYNDLKTADSLSRFYIEYNSEYRRNKLESLSNIFAENSRGIQLNLSNTLLKLSELIDKYNGPPDKVAEAYTSKLVELKAEQFANSVELQTIINSLSQGYLKSKPSNIRTYRDALSEFQDQNCIAQVSALGSLTGKIKSMSIITSSSPLLTTLKKSAQSVRGNLLKSCPSLYILFPTGLLNSEFNSKETRSLTSFDKLISLFDQANLKDAKNTVISNSLPKLLYQLRLLRNDLTQYKTLSAEALAQQKALETLPSLYEEIKLQTNLKIGTWSVVNGPTATKFDLLQTITVLSILWIAFNTTYKLYLKTLFNKLIIRFNRVLDF